jgi:hypothetical protein
VVGTANADALASVTTYEPGLAGTRVTVKLLDGLTHEQEREMIDMAFQAEAAFTRAAK